jgi:hypothetical protein
MTCTECHGSGHDISKPCLGVGCSPCPKCKGLGVDNSKCQCLHVNAGDNEWWDASQCPVHKRQLEAERQGKEK